MIKLRSPALQVDSLLSHQGNLSGAMLLSTRVDQDVLVEKLRPSCTFGGSVSCCSHCGKGYESLRKLELELLYDPAVPFLSIYPKKLKADI